MNLGLALAAVREGSRRWPIGCHFNDGCGYPQRKNLDECRTNTRSADLVASGEVAGWTASSYYLLSIADTVDAGSCCLRFLRRETTTVWRRSSRASTAIELDFAQ